MITFIKNIFVSLVVLIVVKECQPYYNVYVTSFYPSKMCKCNKIGPKDLTPFTTSFRNSTKNYFHYMTIQKSDLYVGAMDYLYKFKDANVSKLTNSYYKKAEAVRSNFCYGTLGHSWEPDCQNNIRYVVINETASKIYNRSNVLLVCFTNGFQPFHRLLDADTFEVLESNDSKMIYPVCANGNISQLYLGKGTGNPGDQPVIYSSTFLGQLADVGVHARSIIQDDKGTVISQPLYTKIDSTNPFLKGANFIATIDGGDVVYTFFREERQFTSCRKGVFKSRVGRVCKSDTGSKFYGGTFVTYIQLQLVCKYEKSNFYFDEMQDVVEINETFYVLFVDATLSSSAICRYQKKNLEEKFKSGVYVNTDGTTFKDHTYKTWECGRNTQRYSINRINFKEYRFFAAGDLVPDKNMYLLYLPGVVLNHLRLDTKISTWDMMVFYAGSSKGEIYQLFMKTILHPDEDEEWYYMRPHMSVGAIIKLQDNDERVASFLFDVDTRQMYVGFDSALYQLSFSNLCHFFKMADGCLHSHQCAWDLNAQKCVDKEATNATKVLLYHDLMNVEAKHDLKVVFKRWVKALNLSLVPEKRNVTIGTTHTMDPEDFKVFLCRRKPYRWYYNNTLIEFKDNPDYIIDVDYKLTIRRMNERLAGLYTVYDQREALIVNVIINNVKAQDVKLMWIEKFHDWCDEFRKYKKTIETWQNNKCSQK